MITFINNFHNKSIRKRVNVMDLLKPREVREMKAKLCGSFACSCSGPTGVRGGDYYAVEWQDGLWQVLDR